MAGRIGFDAKRAFFNRSGLGNYARTLIASLLKYHPEFSYLLFSPGGYKQSLFPLVADHVKLISPETFYQQKIPSLWRSFSITERLKQENISIYHGLSNELPFNIKSSGLKKIVTIHDLIFLRYPNLYPWVDRKIYELKFRKAAEDADIVIAISEATKADLVDFFNIKEEKIKVAYQSCNPSYFSFSPDTVTAEKIKHKFNLPEAFMLYVGTVEERKNLISVLQAMLATPETARVPLVVVGGKRKSYFKKIMAYIIKNKLEGFVLFPDFVDDEELKYFYHLAKLFIYPSFYEGFGLPVIESLLMGTPVITSNTSSLPEAAGPGSILLDKPVDFEEIANAIQSALESEEKCKSMISTGFQWAGQFHPEKTSTTVAKIYQNLL